MQTLRRPRASGFPAVLLLAAAQAAAGTGSDVVVHDIFQSINWTPNSSGGAVVEEGVAYRAYSLGTRSCNTGTVPLDWIQIGTDHPVIAQAMYRLQNNRIEQIGMSWLKHGFCALQESVCGTCQPAGTGCISKLGVGCSDPYLADTNGNQATLGPRWEVNPATGEFVWPYATKGMTGNKVYKRLKVRQEDLALPGAFYFVEAMYIHPDDAADGNNDDNASYRRVSVNATSYNLSMQGTTAKGVPAIQAWRDFGFGPGVPDPSVIVQTVDVAGDGRFWFAYRVDDDDGDGIWHYEYAIQNLNSDRAGGSFAVPVPAGVTVLSTGFHDCFYHSGEPFDNTDWMQQVGGGAVSWHSPNPYEVDPNSNALRFGTLYNFRFDASTPPVAGQVVLGLFKPGEPADVAIPALVPSAPPGCAADLDGDGKTGQADLGILLSAFSTCPGDPGYNPAAGALAPEDPCVNQGDLGALLADFGCD